MSAEPSVASDTVVSLQDAPRLAHRSEALDVLRFVCAAWVLFAHVLPWADLVAGQAVVPQALTFAARALIAVFQPAGETHPAVLSFIVLSGYCVHRNGLRRDRLEGHLAAYAVRRAFRIVPVFLLAIAAGIICWRVAVAASPKMAQLLSGTSEINPVMVVVRALGVPAFAPWLNHLTYAGNAPLHTVMVEIWLYVAYPIGLWLIARLGEARFWAVLGGIWLLGAIACGFNGRLANWWHNGSLAGFLLYWWIGARFIGFVPSERSDRLLQAAVAGWIVLTVVLMLAPMKPLLIVELRKVLFALLIGAAVARLDASQVKVPAVGVWLGKAGYSLYAFHAPVVYTLLILGWHWTAAAFAALVVGTVAYVTCEDPLNKLGRTLSGKFGTNDVTSGISPTTQLRTAPPPSPALPPSRGKGES